MTERNGRIATYGAGVTIVPEMKGSSGCRNRPRPRSSVLFVPSS